MRSAVEVIGTSFLEAARLGDLTLIKKFGTELEDGGHIQICDKFRDMNGRSALHFACEAGNIHICKYLVKRLKHDINAQDVEGVTPLAYAANEGHLHIANYLLDNGADIAKTNNMGPTALHYASINGNVDLLQLLISRGADVDAASTLGSPLSCAAHAENKEAVRVLLQNKANPNIVQDNLFAPLIFSSGLSLEITDLLVKAGADPNINLCGATPLHSAVATHKLEIIKYLLKAGANPNVLDQMGVLPLEKAASIRNLKAMEILFPVTSPIPKIPDWSISGIMSYVTSEETPEKIRQDFNMAKTKALDAISKRDYHAAIFWYTMAITIDPSDAIVYSNRSFCHSCIDMGRCALSDAKACISLKPDWPKAHYREGVAWKLLKNYPESVKSFSAALKLDPNNKDIQKALREAMEAVKSCSFI